MSETFSVVQFFADETYQYVRRGLDAKEALEVVRSYARRPAAEIGIIRRVIITDSGDNTCFEWTFGRGVTYPPEYQGWQPI